MLELIWGNLILRSLFVILAVINVVIDIKVLFKSKYENYEQESIKAYNYFNKTGKSPIVSIFLLLISSIFYFFVGFNFIAYAPFMPLPQVLSLNIFGVIIFSKILILMMNHFCIEGIMQYSKQVFFNDMLTHFIGFACSLLMAVLIAYQTIMKFFM